MLHSSHCKVVLLGQVAAGKSSLLERLINDEFEEHRAAATVGGSYGAKRMQTRHGEIILSVWDTAGSERFDSLSRLYYSGAQAALICVDLTSSSSFSKSQYWVKELLEHQPQSRVYIVLTKCDLLQDPPVQYSSLQTSSPPAEPESVSSGPQCGLPSHRPSQQPGEGFDRFDGDRKIKVDGEGSDEFNEERGMKFERQKSSPTCVLDRTSSSYGSSASRGGTEGSLSGFEKQFRRKEVSDSQLHSMARNANAKVVYTSAASSRGIRELFQMVADDLADTHAQAAASRASQTENEQPVQRMESSRPIAATENTVVKLETPSCIQATRAACCR